MNNKIKFSFILVLIIGIFAFFSCKKDFSDNQPSTFSMNNSYAYLKVVDVSPNFAHLAKGKDTFNVLVNGQKISGFTLSYGLMYPNSISSTTYTDTYASVPVGTNTIQLAMGVNKPDSIVYVTLHENMVGGQRYSLLVTDSILNSSSDSSKMFVRDDYTDNSVIANVPLNGFVILRYAHLVLNDTGKTDLYSYALGKTIWTNIRPDSISQYSLVGYNYSAPDTFYVLRSLPTGTKVPPFAQRQILAKIAFGANVTGSNISPVGRAFTFIYKGNIDSTGSKAPSILTYIQ